jgi:hypothetical protein
MLFLSLLYKMLRNPSEKLPLVFPFPSEHSYAICSVLSASTSCFHNNHHMLVYHTLQMYSTHYFSPSLSLYIYLKYKSERVWAHLNWLRLVSSGRSLCTQLQTFRFLGVGNFLSESSVT